PVAGPRRRLAGLGERSGFPQGRETTLTTETLGGGHRILGIHPCPDQADVHGPVLRDSPLRGGHLIGHSVAPPDRAACRHRGITGPKPFPILPRSVSRTTRGGGRERGELGDDRKDPPRRDPAA